MGRYLNHSDQENVCERCLNRRRSRRQIRAHQQNAIGRANVARMAVAKWASGVGSKEDLPGMFVAHNDEMALGVRQALRDIDSQRSLPLATPQSRAVMGRKTFGQRPGSRKAPEGTVIMPPGSGWPSEWIPARGQRRDSPFACFCGNVISRDSQSHG